MKNIIVVLFILAVGAFVKFNAYSIATNLPDYMNAIIFLAVFFYSFFVLIRFIVRKKNESDDE